MSTPDTVKAQLQSLIAAANSATGKSDTTLSAAVASLAAGFGGGAGLACATGSFTVAKNTAAASDIPAIHHGLGVKPRIFLCWLDATINDMPFGLPASCGWILLDIREGAFSVPQILTTGVNRADGIVALGGSATANAKEIGWSKSTSTAYILGDNSDETVYNETEVKLRPVGSTYYLLTGFSYKWLAIA